MIRELAVRKNGGQWATLAKNVTPEFRVVSGMRRITQQQLRPDSIQALGGKVSAKVLELYKKDEDWVDQAVKEGQIKESDVERWKWEAFWDAPLYLEGSGVRPPTHATSIPPMHGIFKQKGLPRTPDEVIRASATYKVQDCTVKNNGARLEITFPGVTLGVFDGRLQYDLFKGSSLIRQVVIAKTDRDSVAYKYDAGLKGLAIQPASRVAWRDLAGNWQEQRLGGPVNKDSATVWTSNRLIAAEVPGGAIAAFPPPHSFFGARESNQVLGDNYYRKDSDAAFAFGIRQAEKEEDPEFLHNFALTSARPGTWQRMPVFLYVTAEPAAAAVDAALRLTHGDKFKPLPGYQVMGSHYHVGMVARLKETGSLDNRLNDVDAAKAVGINIFGIIDGVRGELHGEEFLAAQAEYYEAAKRQSDRTFLIMPNKENTGDRDRRPPRPDGVETGLLAAEARRRGSRSCSSIPKYGKVYNLGGPDGPVRDGQAREPARQHAASPLEGVDGLPGCGQGEAHFHAANYEGWDIAGAWASTARRRGSVRSVV